MQGIERSRSCLAGVCLELPQERPTFIGQSRYRVGLSGQYYIGTTRFGRNAGYVCATALFHIDYRGKSVAGVWVGGRKPQGTFRIWTPLHWMKLQR